MLAMEVQEVVDTQTYPQTVLEVLLFTEVVGEDAVEDTP
jgi:hypothetical protein